MTKKYNMRIAIITLLMFIWSIVYWKLQIIKTEKLLEDIQWQLQVITNIVGSWVEGQDVINYEPSMRFSFWDRVVCNWITWKIMDVHWKPRWYYDIVWDKWYNYSFLEEDCRPE